MNSIGYTRLGESERRLFRMPVQDIVDFPLGVVGSYRYNESVIVVSANGTYRCLEVWGNDDYTTTVGMVAGQSTPPYTWLPGPIRNQSDADRSNSGFFNYSSFPCAIVLYDWTSLDKSPPFVRWSGMFHGVPSGALRDDVSRIAIYRSARLYAPGMALLPGSFRDPAQVSPISEQATVGLANALGAFRDPSQVRPTSEPATVAPTTTTTTTPVRSGPDTAMLVGGVVIGVVIIMMILASIFAKRHKRHAGKSSFGGA